MVSLHLGDLLDVVLEDDAELTFMAAADASDWDARFVAGQTRSAECDLGCAANYYRGTLVDADNFTAWLADDNATRTVAERVPCSNDTVALPPEHTYKLYAGASLTFARLAFDGGVHDSATSLAAAMAARPAVVFVPARPALVLTGPVMDDSNNSRSEDAIKAADAEAAEQCFSTCAEAIGDVAVQRHRSAAVAMPFYAALAGAHVYAVSLGFVLEGLTENDDGTANVSTPDASDVVLASATRQLRASVPCLLALPPSELALRVHRAVPGLLPDSIPYVPPLQLLSLTWDGASGVLNVTGHVAGSPRSLEDEDLHGVVSLAALVARQSSSRTSGVLDVALAVYEVLARLAAECLDRDCVAAFNTTKCHSLAAVGPNRTCSLLAQPFLALSRLVAIFGVHDGFLLIFFLLGSVRCRVPETILPWPSPEILQPCRLFLAPPTTTTTVSKADAPWCVNHRKPCLRPGGAPWPGRLHATMLCWPTTLQQSATRARQILPTG
jgi:hypothetical protein